MTNKEMFICGPYTDTMRFKSISGINLKHNNSRKYNDYHQIHVPKMISWLIIVISIVSSSGCWPGEKVTNKLEELERIESTIPIPSSFTETGKSSGGKPEMVCVAREFSSNESYSVIKQFFMQELRKSGWKYLGEDEIKGGGESLGGRAIEFTKDGNKLTVQYAGDEANYGWDYGISLSWKP